MRCTGTWCKACTNYGLCDGPTPEEQAEAIDTAYKMVQDMDLGPKTPKGAGVDI